MFLFPVGARRWAEAGWASAGADRDPGHAEPKKARVAEEVAEQYPCFDNPRRLLSLLKMVSSKICVPI